jgi:hypothetical protein
MVSQSVHNWRIAAVLRYQNGQLMEIPYSNNGLGFELPNTIPGIFQFSSFATLVPGAPLFASGLGPNCHCFNAQTQLILNPAAFSQTPLGQFSPTELSRRGFLFHAHAHSVLSLYGRGPIRTQNQAQRA